ncbi:pancreatic triacylglycerol lipase-like [Neocloeon triangulifer]|uniref:pancreatic triacylglycerol lipase-like n=1 Tax=Neocloeon triangulifer TaxID=2078957 RepID=UPI00286F1659|nr:pancreatic triacylglycerol lipase-like [Neocloeon triangulifer]
MPSAVNYSYPVTVTLVIIAFVLLSTHALPQFSGIYSDDAEGLENANLPEGEAQEEILENRDLRDCFTTDLECPNENVTFHLYTRSNPETPYDLKLDDKSIRNAPFVKDRPIKILIHGFTGNKDFSPNTEIRPALLEHGDYNVISVDWGKLAASPCYLQATYNVEASGKCTAQLIEVLVRNYHVPLKSIHVIGFSLGAQASGQVAKYLKENNVGKLRRITGLDPAMPLFATLHRSSVLDRSDAHFVDVIHTNAGNKGKLGPNGHVDFYVNGGTVQPGCAGPEVYDPASCAHARAPIYYAESIGTSIGFWGKECRSWLAFRSNLCDWSTDSIALMGENADSRKHGQFFLDSQSHSPFAMGIENMYGKNYSPRNANATLK